MAALPEKNSPQKGNISFDSIIQVGGKIITQCRAVLSTLVLFINNQRQLCLTRFSQQMYPLFTRKICSLKNTYIETFNFCISEDSRGFIHVVMPFTDSVKILSRLEEPINHQIPENVNTLILKLENNGELSEMDTGIRLSNYNLVNIKGLTWMFSNCKNSIQIRNLTMGGMISYIFSSGSIVVSSVFYLNNHVYITGNAEGEIAYNDMSIRLPACSYLLILDVSGSKDVHGGSNGDHPPNQSHHIDRKWKIANYFYATTDSTILAMTSFRMNRGNYILAGYCNAQNIKIYHKQQMIRSFNLPKENMLFLCKIDIQKMKVTLIHHPFNFTIGQRLFLHNRRNTLFLSGLSNNSQLIKIIRGKIASHIEKYNFLITFDSNLSALHSLFFGSGKLNYRMTRGDCNCNDMPGANYGHYNPNRIMRMLEPGATTTIGMGLGCPRTQNKGVKMEGSTCNLDAASGFNTSLSCVFTTYKGNYHGLPAVNYSNTDTSPGDLYNTKYAGYSSLPVTETLEMVEAQNGPMYSNEVLYIDEESEDINLQPDTIDTTDIYSSSNLIDNLIVNDSPTKNVYSNMNTGYLLRFRSNSSSV